MNAAMNSRFANKLINRLARLAAIALICGAAGAGFGCSSVGDMNNYLKAVEHYESGDFENARRYFSLANGYEKSDEYLSAIAEYERLYIEAVGLMQERQYEEAQSIFDSIPDYMNSREQSEYISGLKANYETGIEKYEAMDYDAALGCFISAAGYASSDSYIENIENMSKLYDEAVRFARANMYGEAISMLRKINTDYRGAYALIDELYSKLSAQPVTLHEYAAAYEKSWSLSGREADVVISNRAANAFTITDGDILITGICDESGAIVELAMLLPAEYTREEADEAAAHFIHAVNPGYMDCAEVAAAIDDYLEGRADYCGMRISAAHDELQRLSISMRR